MDRRQFLVQSSLLAAGAALPFNALAGVQGNFTTLRRNVGYFTEGGGTIGWLASPEAMVVVDSQFPESARNCLNGLKDRTEHPLDLLINTHHHGDHVSGNPVFKEEGGTMAAHQNVPKLMRKAARESEEEATMAYPSTTYADKWQMDAGDDTLVGGSGNDLLNDP